MVNGSSSNSNRIIIYALLADRLLLLLFYFAFDLSLKLFCDIFIPMWLPVFLTLNTTLGAAVAVGWIQSVVVVDLYRVVFCVKELEGSRMHLSRTRRTVSAELIIVNISV